MNKLTCLTILTIAVGTAALITKEDWVIFWAVILCVALTSELIE